MNSWMALRNEPSPNRINRSRQDSLIVRTNRSAWAFKFGERWRQLNRSHSGALQDLNEFRSEQGIAVMDKVSLPGQEAFRSTAEIACDLTHPKAVRLPRHSGDLDSPTRQIDQEEHQEPRQALARPGLDREEIRCHDHFSVLRQALLRRGFSLTLRRRFQPVLLQKVGDGAARDF